MGKYYNRRRYYNRKKNTDTSVTAIIAVMLTITVFLILLPYRIIKFFVNLHSERKNSVKSDGEVFSNRNFESTESKLYINGYVKTSNDTAYYGDETVSTYERKESIMSEYEQAFFKKLNNVVAENYNVLPQVNLLSIINKVSYERYRNELFRNVDFGIFSKTTFEPLVLIELNDKTHAQKKRHIRDLKVREICDEAEIPLITFYSSYENEEEYLRRRLSEFINLDSQKQDSESLSAFEKA